MVFAGTDGAQSLSFKENFGSGTNRNADLHGEPLFLLFPAAVDFTQNTAV